MLIDSFISIVFSPVYALLSLLPDIDLSLPDNIFNSISSILSNVAYVLPVAPLLPILAISLSLSVFRSTWALIIRIKSFIPTMGA